MRVGETRTVGRTGLTVTALGMGTAAMGGLYAPVSASASLAAFEAAWQAGIRHFDSAPMYGLGRAEHLLGHFLQEKASAGASFTVSTKVGRLMARALSGIDNESELAAVKRDVQKLCGRFPLYAARLETYEGALAKA